VSEGVTAYGIISRGVKQRHMQPERVLGHVSRVAERTAVELGRGIERLHAEGIGISRM